jgi:hypothetical protein
MRKAVKKEEERERMRKRDGKRNAVGTYRGEKEW